MKKGSYTQNFLYFFFTAKFIFSGNLWGRGKLHFILKNAFLAIILNNLESSAFIFLSFLTQSQYFSHLHLHMFIHSWKQYQKLKTVRVLSTSMELIITFTSTVEPSTHWEFFAVQKTVHNTLNESRFSFILWGETLRFDSYEEKKPSYKLLSQSPLYH